MKNLLSAIGEFGLIDQLKKNIFQTKNVVLGIGDDAAVLRFEPGLKKFYQLFTTDMMVEDVHFTRKMNPRSIGHKALACNISDIAAMGGLPTHAVISLAAPAELEIRFVKDLYRGINELAKRFKVSIVGGDTVKSSKIVINLALLGRVKKSEVVTRSGAEVGDVIFVTGALGRSFQTDKHLKFFPKVAESQFLVKHFRPTAMIDISDGLSADLGHILSQSRVGALLQEELIPKTKHATLQNALSDGEDYELLFTLKKKDAQRLTRLSPKSYFPIGAIMGEKNKIFLIDQNAHRREIKVAGFKHF